MNYSEAIMSQNGRKMAKMLHNAAQKFDWDTHKEFGKVYFRFTLLPAFIIALYTNSLYVLEYTNPPPMR